MSSASLVRILHLLGHGWVALAIGAVALATTPVAPWRVLGPLTFALVLGVGVRAVRDSVGRSVSATEDTGLRAMATTLLRLGVVVSALRLDWTSIARAGVQPWLVAIVAIATGFGVMALLASWLRLRGPLVALIAIGTSVCGAAAITAAAPRLDASDEDVTTAIATVSVFGAVLSLAFVIAHATMGIDATTYALVTGGSLHEVAHVMAAASAVPAAAGLALLTKLARVALLPIGLALVSGFTSTETRGTRRGAAVPGLAIAFFAASLIGSIPGWIPGLPASVLAATDIVRGALLISANAMLAVSMAAIGLRMSPSLIARTDRRLLGAAAMAALLLLAAVLIASSILTASTTPPRGAY